mmetsp:Transcript_33847/g.91608  ORF Transcript_33847/g.91608 Transcript_33847/m.91608 type:complete len:928 (-) Transcript_33847:243-3026(-)
MTLKLLVALLALGASGLLFQTDTSNNHGKTNKTAKAAKAVKAVKAGPFTSAWRPHDQRQLPEGVNATTLATMGKYYNPSGRPFYVEVPPPPGLPLEVYQRSRHQKKASAFMNVTDEEVAQYTKKMQEEVARMETIGKMGAEMPAQEATNATESSSANSSRYVPIDISIDIADPFAKFPDLEYAENYQIARAWVPVEKMDWTKGEDPYQVENIADGDDTTVGGGKTIVLDLGNPQVVNVVQIDWLICACRISGSVLLQISQDGIGWTTVHTPYVAAWGNHIVRSYEIDKMFQFWRIMPTEIGPMPWVGVSDIKMWGETKVRFPNTAGWYHSYQAGVGKQGGTEITHMLPLRGKLYATTGYWMTTKSWWPAEVAVLECPMCDWQTDHLTMYAGRIEGMKVLTWTHDRGGNAFPEPASQLYISYYINWLGEGRGTLEMQHRPGKWGDNVYFRRPYNPGAFSSRALTLYMDPVLGVQFLFISAGTYGITASYIDRTSPTLTAPFPTFTETGPVPVRPLGIVEMDGNLYFSTGKLIMRRVNGWHPSWVTVFEMPGDGLEAATGGIRGLSTIDNPASTAGVSLYYAWVPNHLSEGCMYRLDPCSGSTCTGDSAFFNSEEEVCVTDLMRDYLGSTEDGKPAFITYVIANYNYVTPFSKPSGDTGYMFGFESLLLGYSVEHFAVDPNKDEKLPEHGYRENFYAGGGYVVRHNKSSFEIREVNGQRYNPEQQAPLLTAVRTIGQSPFGDGAFYFGGYDPNFFPVTDTAWAMRGEDSAVWKDPVPCLPEEGCPHRPAEPWKAWGCDLCRTWDFHAEKVAFWYDRDAGPDSPPVGQPGVAVPMRCQGVLSYLNTFTGLYHCPAARDWGVAANCCAHRGCDICKNFPFLKFDKFALAGYDSTNGYNYNCQNAFEFMHDNDMSCDHATQKWGEKCCVLKA